LPHDVLDGFDDAGEVGHVLFGFYIGNMALAHIDIA
jgi:hypothetical protein